jgi:hypothetical protein
MRKYDKADQTEQDDTETIYVQRQEPGLTQTENSENDHPHRYGFKIFDT